MFSRGNQAGAYVKYPATRSSLGLKPAGQTGRMLWGRTKHEGQQPHPLLWLLNSPNHAPQGADSCDLLLCQVCPCRWRMQQQSLLSSEAQPHCAATKDLGPWPISRARAGGSLCVGFSVKAHPEPWKCLLNPFFLVLQVTVVVWRDTPRARGLPGRLRMVNLQQCSLCK